MHPGLKVILLTNWKSNTNPGTATGTLRSWMPKLIWNRKETGSSNEMYIVCEEGLKTELEGASYRLKANEGVAKAALVS